MFDFVHENKRLVQIFFALITLPFIVWGVSSYDQQSSHTQEAASVAGSVVTQQEFENALRMQQDRMRKQLGPNADTAILESPELKKAVLENLVTQRLMQVQAQSVGLVTTDQQIAQVVTGIDAFQKDGKFDKTSYEAALRAQNLTPLIFEERLRNEFVGQQFQDSYMQNGFSADSVVENAARLTRQKRIVSVVPIETRALIAQVKVEDAEIKRYYESNQNEFQIPEQAKVEYVKFSTEGLMSKAEVSKDEALQYYNDHQADYGSAEERQAAHILIAVTSTAPQTEQDAAKAKAESLLQQVKQNPKKFADLAKANSQDPGSAVKGGDLGYFGRGMMVKPFEDAVFAMQTGTVSELVRSDFGYHIIKLLAVKPSRTLPFDEAREGIVNKLRQQKAADMFAGLAEKFSNAVYEQSDTLKPAADLAGVKTEQSGWLSKNIALPDPLWTPKMLQAVFTDEVLKRKRNSAVVEVEANTLVAAHLLEYKPAAVSALAEVQATIRQKLLRNRAQELAAKQGKELLAQLQAGSKPTVVWKSVQEVTRGKHDGIDTELARQIFQADAGKLPQYVGAESGDGYLIVRVEAVKDGDPVTDADRMRYAKQLRKLSGEAMLQAYLEDAKQHTKIRMDIPTAPAP